MKELTLNEAPHAVVVLPADVVALLAETQRAVSARSTIVWGEHCSECAYPVCYQSCEFYTPRPDGHCRRFARGIERLDLKDAGASSSAMSRIVFGRWGKLEGWGPARLIARDEAINAERRADVLDRLLTALPVPHKILDAAGRWINRRRKRAAEGSGAPVATVFIVETWLPTPPTIAFTLSVVPHEKSVNGLFQHPFTLKPGYNRIIVNVEAMVRTVALEGPFFVQIEPVGDAPPTPIVFGLVDFATLSAPLPPLPQAESAERGGIRTAKCVVWDLDNTLWDGTLAEDGIEGLVLRPEAVKAIRVLDERGVLNAVASKNDDEPARAALEHFGLADFFLFPQISWGPKSESIRRIATAMDIGLDTFVFVDDQPFERGEVSAALPMVKVFDASEVADFETHALFDVPVTAESSVRRLMYRDEERRHDAAAGAAGDYVAFLRGCDIRLEISPVTDENRERVYELTQRTNQLNVTGSRYSRDDVNAIMNGGPLQGMVLRCRDTFGDYGIIGFCVVDVAAAEVAAFFMSCRVQRKKVENAFFCWLGGRLAANGEGMLSVRYRKTERNDAAARMFEELGFRFQGDAGAGVYTRDLSAAWAESDVVAVNSDGFDLPMKPAAEVLRLEPAAR